MKPGLPDEERLWHWVQHRAQSTVPSFVYAVRTTGIFCIPSCASRRPNRKNVRFFASARDARRAGFRACLRCKPDALESNQQEGVAAIMERVCHALESAHSMPKVQALASAVGLSPSYLQRTFKRLTGLTLSAWFQNARRRRMLHALRSSRSVTDAIYASGHQSTGRFYEDLDGALGMTPAQFRKGGAGATLAFTTGPSPYGQLLIAGTPQSLSAVLLGETQEKVADELSALFPKAHLVRADAVMAALLQDVIQHVEQPCVENPLPLQLLGTAFQIRVWEALTKIPAGCTTTYGELALALDVPSGARAVASACAANHLAIVIPCHRVLRANGDLAGYRWGVHRKQKLLQDEATPAD